MNCSGYSSSPSRCSSKKKKPKQRWGCENTGGGLSVAGLGCCLYYHRQQQEASMEKRRRRRLKRRCCCGDDVLIKPETISNRNGAIIALRGDDELFWILFRSVKVFKLKEDTQQGCENTGGGTRKREWLLPDEAGALLLPATTNSEKGEDVLPLRQDYPSKNKSNGRKMAMRGCERRYCR